MGLSYKSSTLIIQTAQLSIIAVFVSSGFKEHKKCGRFFISSCRACSLMK